MLTKVYEKGCPVCKGTVKGNHRDKYFCESCNLLFRTFQIRHGAKFKEVITDNKKIKERLDKSKED